MCVPPRWYTWPIIELLHCHPAYPFISPMSDSLDTMLSTISAPPDDGVQDEPNSGLRELLVNLRLSGKSHFPSLYSTLITRRCTRYNHYLEVQDHWGNHNNHNPTTKWIPSCLQQSESEVITNPIFSEPKCSHLYAYGFLHVLQCKTAAGYRHIFPWSLWIRSSHTTSTWNQASVPQWWGQGILGGHCWTRSWCLFLLVSDPMSLLIMLTKYCRADVTRHTNYVSGSVQKCRPTFTQALNLYTTKYDEGSLEAKPVPGGPFWQSRKKIQTLPDPTESKDEMWAQIEKDEGWGNRHSLVYSCVAISIKFHVHCMLQTNGE